MFTIKLNKDDKSITLKKTLQNITLTQVGRRGVAGPTGTVEDATLLVKGIVQLAGDFAGTAASPRVKTRTMTVSIGPENADYITDGTDDDVQIQAAIDEVSEAGGGSIFIQAGDYYFGSPVIKKSEVEIYGQGMYLTRIHAAVGWGSGALFSSTGYTPENTLKHFILRDLELDGSNMATTPYQIGRKGVDGHNMENCMFQRLYIHDTPATGLGIDNLYRVLIDHCIIKDCGTASPPSGQGSNGVGIGTGGMTHESVIVTNCITEGIANSGFLLEDLESIVDDQKLYIFANNISINDFTGISISGTDNAIVVGNSIYSPSNNGIRCIDFVTHYVDAPIIKNNFVTGATSYGILLESNVTNFNLEGNTVVNGTVEGILIRGRIGNVVNNIVHGNGKHGIFLGGGSGGPDITDVIIANNQVYNNSVVTANSDGIRLDGANVNFSNISIHGNRCFDNQAVKTQRYGVIYSGTKSGGGHSYINLGFNNLLDNKTGAWLQSNFTATNLSFWKNFGLTNDNSLVAFDMGSNKITSLADPTTAQDAATKAYADSGTATLTGKTIDLGSNTLTATLAQLNAAISNADVASLAGVETLTNKTIDGGTFSNASTFTGAARMNVTNRTGSVTLTGTTGEYQMCNATSGVITVTVPSTTIAGIKYTIKKTDASANAVNVVVASSGTIDGASTYALASQYKYVTVVTTSTAGVVMIVANN